MLTIYHAVGTRSLRVIWTCEELKISYQVETIPFTAEFRASQEWRNMNPVGKVPVLQDDDFIMFESGAMVQYILDRHGNGQLQPKPGTPEHGLYLQWCWFAESTFARPIGEIVNHRRVFEEHQQSDEAINEIFSKYDRNQDGVINWEEFKTMMIGMKESKDDRFGTILKGGKA